MINSLNSKPLFLSFNFSYFLLASLNSTQFGNVFIRPVAVYGDMAQRFIHCGIFVIGKGHFRCSKIFKYSCITTHTRNRNDMFRVHHPSQLNLCGSTMVRFGIAVDKFEQHPIGLHILLRVTCDYTPHIVSLESRMMILSTQETASHR